MKRNRENAGLNPGFYELIDHTADMGIRVWGQSLKELYANAGRALFDLITDPRTVAADTVEPVTVNGDDRVDLMVNWLRELLFLWTGEEKLVREIEIGMVSATRLDARVRIAPYHAGRHVIRHEIKAVTYHQAAVERYSGGWTARIIFDV